MRKLLFLFLFSGIIVFCGIIFYKSAKVEITNTPSEKETSVLAAFNYARNNIWGKAKSIQLPSPTPSPKLTLTKTPVPTRTPLPTSGQARPTRTPIATAVKTPTPTRLPTPTVSGNTNSTSVYITFYGWNDNDPPGAEIAYSKSDYSASVHDSAGGTGSFTDPVSFASDPKLFSAGTKIYIPYIKKYAIMEDWCAACVSDYKSGKKHIDIWAGGDGNNEAKLLTCEEDWTRDAENIELNPPMGYEVNTTPIFDSNSAVCLNQ